MNKKTFRRAFQDSLPVMAGYVVIGIGYGVLLSAKGFSPWWALLMCVAIYAGSSQFVGVELMASGASLLSAALMALLVNARHLFYGISMVDSYRPLGKSKWYAAYALSDETYSLVCKAPALPEEIDRKGYILLVSFLDQSYWICGSLLGALLGSILPFDSTGIDFAMTALFVSVLVEQWEQTKEHRPALFGLGLSLLCLLLFGADSFLIPAMLSITAVLLLSRRRLERGEAE